MTGEFTVSFDTTELNRQVDELKALLERLPENVANSIRERIASIPESELGIEFETLPMVCPGCICFGVQIRALNEFCKSSVEIGSRLISEAREREAGRKESARTD